jgi:hypothetical protein
MAKKKEQNTTQKIKNWASGQKSRFCSTRGTRRVTLVKNSVINHERGKDDYIETLYGEIPVRLYKHWDTVSTETYTPPYKDVTGMLLHTNGKFTM